MDSVNALIWKKFRVKRNDTLPFKGWNGKRELLGELFAELGYNYGAEIGVQRGYFSETLFKANPKLRLFCIDPWKGFSRRIDDKVNQEYFEECMERLSPYNAVFIRSGSMEAVRNFKDNSFDFIYIDQMHDFDSIMSDLIFWVPKVRPGGIVSGHDFCKNYQYGVLDAVYAYTRAHNIHQWYITRDHEASFFWVR